MCVSEKILEDKVIIDKSGHRVQKYVYLNGKKNTPKQLHKKIKRKPRLIGTILTNLFIIIAIVITIVLVTGLLG